MRHPRSKFGLIPVHKGYSKLIEECQELAQNKPHLLTMLRECAKAKEAIRATREEMTNNPPEKDHVAEIRTGCTRKQMKKASMTATVEPGSVDTESERKNAGAQERRLRGTELRADVEQAMAEWKTNTDEGYKGLKGLKKFLNKRKIVRRQDIPDEQAHVGANRYLVESSVWGWTSGPATTPMYFKLKEEDLVE